MTMREEFEAWVLTVGLPNSNEEFWSWSAWQAAYRAGAEAMRERAVGRAMEWAEAARKDGREYGVALDIVAAIRALPLEEQP